MIAGLMEMRRGWAVVVAARRAGSGLTAWAWVEHGFDDRIGGETRRRLWLGLGSVMAAVGDGGTGGSTGWLG